MLILDLEKYYLFFLQSLAHQQSGGVAFPPARAIINLKSLRSSSSRNIVLIFIPFIASKLEHLQFVFLFSLAGPCSWRNFPWGWFFPLLWFASYFCVQGSQPSVDGRWMSWLRAWLFQMWLVTEFLKLSRHLFISELVHISQMWNSTPSPPTPNSHPHGDNWERWCW